MEEEIKEINITFPRQILDYVDTKEHLLKLFNYIANLQEENEYLKKNQRFHKKFGSDYIFCLEADKETYKDMVLEKQEELKSANESISWWQNRFNAVEKENKRLKEENKRIFSKVNDDEILDCITNLQQENQDIKDTLQDKLDYIGHLKELCDKYEEEHNTEFNEWVFDKRENERLTQGVTLLTNKLIDMTKEKEDYKSRIDKAIEVISKEFLCYDNESDEYIQGKKVINILQEGEE